RTCGPGALPFLGGDVGTHRSGDAGGAVRFGAPEYRQRWRGGEAGCWWCRTSSFAESGLDRSRASRILELPAPDLVQRRSVDQPEGCGVLGGAQRVLHEEHFYSPVTHFLDERPYRPIPVVLADVADVDGRDTIGMAPHDLRVDLRVLLTTVAEEDEVEAPVRVEDSLDGGHFVLDVAPGEEHVLGEAVVLQQERPERDAVDLEDLG